MNTTQPNEDLKKIDSRTFSFLSISLLCMVLVIVVPCVIFYSGYKKVTPSELSSLNLNLCEKNFLTDIAETRNFVLGHDIPLAKRYCEWKDSPQAKNSIETAKIEKEKILKALAP
jgi:hypothetical protein